LWARALSVRQWLAQQKWAKHWWARPLSERESSALALSDRQWWALQWLALRRWARQSLERESSERASLAQQ